MDYDAIAGTLDEICWFLIRQRSSARKVSYVSEAQCNAISGEMRGTKWKEQRILYRRNNTKANEYINRWLITERCCYSRNNAAWYPQKQRLASFAAELMFTCSFIHSRLIVIWILRARFLPSKRTNVILQYRILIIEREE